MALTPLQVNQLSPESIATLRGMLQWRDRRSTESRIRDLLQRQVKGLSESSASKWAALILERESKEEAVLYALGLVDNARNATRADVRTLSAAQRSAAEKATNKSAEKRKRRAPPAAVAAFKARYFKDYDTLHGWAKAAAGEFGVPVSTVHLRIREYAKGAKSSAPARS
jgi:hypothetical protein